MVSEKIREIRELSGLNQSNFGAKLGVNQRTVSNWEADRNQPPIEILQLMLRTWDISASWLLLDEGEINSPIDKLFLQAKKYSFQNKSEYDLQNDLTLFLNKQYAIAVTKKIEKIKGQTVLEKISEAWTGKGERMLRVLYYFLEYLQKQNIQFNQISMKNDFIEALKSFDIPSDAKIIFISSMAKDHKALIEWASKELDESSIFEILSALPVLITDTKERMNLFDQFLIKITSK
ncbi:MAG: helix-turn-helix transcriptional regulator [Sulfuricurvum sp.]|nr:helix-turn-helix transcriptional regulator [Sulfuricurvum sp.]